MKMKKSGTIVFLGTLIASLLISVPSVIAAENPYGGTAVTPPAPTEVIFSIVQGGKSKNYSMNDLIKMKPKTISIYEPFVKKRQTFLAIPLSVFVKDAKISATAKLSTVALNDYIYANSVKNFIKAKAYIAINRSGKPIPYDQGGPLRIIYPADSMWAKSLDPWNWSLRSIVVK